MSDILRTSHLFRTGEIARIVSAAEMDYTVNSDNPEYGLAIVLDGSYNIVDYVRRGDPPRRLVENNSVLIATTGRLRVNYLSGVPDQDSKYDTSIRIGALYENRNGKQERVRCKIGLEFRIARNKPDIAQSIYTVMREKNANRLLKKDFLSKLGWQFGDNVHHILHTFLKDNGADVLESSTGRRELGERARTELESRLGEEGLEYIDLLANVDRRSLASMIFVPDFKYDHKLIIVAKLVSYTVSIVSSVVGLLFALDILPP